VRVTAGTLRGRALAVPASARPSAGRLREALLSSWQLRLPGAAVLDLYAGSGAVGVESLSRGAAHATFVERDRAALAALRSNCALAPAAGWEICPGDVIVVLRQLAQRSRRYDLIFADPPYAELAAEELLALAGRLLLPGGELALEHDRCLPVPLAVGPIRQGRQRHYGASGLTYYVTQAEISAQSAERSIDPVDDLRRPDAEDQRSAGGE
jgi:16S rRNA (guanine966-N2)-methyltransferase